MLRNGLKKQLWIIVALASIPAYFSCQQGGNSNQDNPEPEQQQEQVCYICDELESLYKTSIPAKEKKVQNTFWNISFGESVDAVYRKLKSKGMISNDDYKNPRFKTGSSFPFMIDFGSSNCSKLTLLGGCQFAGHSFYKVDLFFTPPPYERFFAIDFINADNPRLLFQNIIQNYPIKKNVEYPSEMVWIRDTVFDTILGQKRVIKSINTSYRSVENTSKKGSVKYYSYKNGCEIFIYRNGSDLLYINEKILKEDIGNTSEL